MAKILNNLNPTQTTKAYETGNYLYFNGVAYNKNTLAPIPFIPFTNDSNQNNMMFNSMLSSKKRTYYWNTRMLNSMFLDNKEADTYFCSEMMSASNYSGSVDSIYLNKIKEKEKVLARMEVYYSSVYGLPLIKIIGQNDTYAFCIFQDGYSSTSYVPNNTSYPMKANIGYFYKNNSNSYIYSITSSLRSAGEVQVLKEDETTIILIISDNGYKYNVVSISKEGRTATTLFTFQALEDDVIYKNIDTMGVSLSQVKKITDDKFEVYISAQKTDPVTDGGTQTYTNVLSKAIIDLSDNTSIVKAITLDEEPQFIHKLAQYYNNISIIEKNNKKFLMTSTYITGAYSIPTNILENKAIQIFELNEDDEDNITGTEVYSMKFNQFNGSFQGFLQNQDNLFVAVTDKTTLFLKFNLSEKNLKMLDVGIDHELVGMDLNGNFYVQNSSKEVYYFNSENMYNFKLEEPTDEFTYEGTDIDTNIKISAKNLEDEYIELDVRLVIVGDAKFKNEDSQSIITKTLTTGVKEIPITITGGGNVKIVPFVKL